MVNHQAEMSRQLSASLTAEDLVHLKAWGFSGAGVSLAMILLLVQIAKPMPNLEPDLGFALHCSAIALPIWFCYGVSFSFWLAFKLTFVDLHASMKRQVVLFIAPVSALVLNLTAVFFILRHFHELSAGLFAVSVGVSGIFLWLFLRSAGVIMARRYWQSTARE